MKKVDVINHFGTQADVASALSRAGWPISQPAVSKWPENVPELRAFQLERITDGALRADSVPEPLTAA